MLMSKARCQLCVRGSLLMSACPCEWVGPRGNQRNQWHIRLLIVNTGLFVSPPALAIIPANNMLELYVDRMSQPARAILIFCKCAPSLAKKPFAGG